MGEALLVKKSNNLNNKSFAMISVTYPQGSVCTCSNSDGSKILEDTDTNGKVIFNIPKAGTWTVTATQGSNSKSKTVTIDTEGRFEQVNLSFEFVLFDATLASEYYCTSNYIAPVIDTSKYSELEVTGEFASGILYGCLIVGFSANPANVAYGSPPTAELVFSTPLTKETKTLDISSLSGNMYLGVWFNAMYNKDTLKVQNSTLYMNPSDGDTTIYKIVLR